MVLTLEIKKQKVYSKIMLTKTDLSQIEKLVQERTKQLYETQIELEKSKRLSDIGVLAATVAHELRNPLASISIALYNIKRKAKNPDIDKHLVNIEKKITESEQIINNLLNYSNLKPPQFENVNIFDILKETIELIETKSDNLSIIKNINSIESLIIEADPIQIKEVFNNILNNANDAVPSKTGKIKISGEDLDKYIKISFEDNGTGIEKDIIDKVFDPFFTTKSKGTGLGLSICRQIVDFHNGSIFISGENGLGTTVIVWLRKNR